MFTSKKMTLKPLFESEKGIHLTIYLVNRGNLIEVKKQLREAINEAYMWLLPVLSVEERNKFLEPLRALTKDVRILKQMKGNIGVFRNQEIFRVLNVPVDVERTCQVATTFHIKPLIRWLQTDQEFLLLGLESEAAHLYSGSKDSLKLIDSVLFPRLANAHDNNGDYLSLKVARQNKGKDTEIFKWLNNWITQLTVNSQPKLFLSGEKYLVGGLCSYMKYKNVIQTPISNYFSKAKVYEHAAEIRKILKEESRALVDKALMEFRFAEESNRSRKNIFQISKAVVQGRVKKLIVTDELSIFGKIDRKSGGLAIHPFDLDHEDDDVLDDLAQMVLSQGGEVVVASRSEIPKGRPILAILDDDGYLLEKANAQESGELLQERFG